MRCWCRLRRPGADFKVYRCWSDSLLTRVTGRAAAAGNFKWFDWIEKIKPDSIAVERVFAQANRASAMETAQAAGIALLLAAQRNIPVALHTPTEVKAAVTGSGVAGKPQVGEMVKRLLKLDEIPKPADSADALALAICHIIRAPMKARIENARLR